MNCSSVKKNSIIVFVINLYFKVFNICFDDVLLCLVVFVIKVWICYCLNYICIFNLMMFFFCLLRVIIVKLIIFLCYYDNLIFILLRFCWEMFLKLFFIVRFYIDKLMN